MRLVVRTLLVLGFLGAVTGGSYAAYAKHVPPPGVIPGVRVDGEVAPQDGLRDFVVARAEALKARKIKLIVFGGANDAVSNRVLEELTLGELGLEIDVDAVVSRVKAIGAGSDLLARVDLAERAARGEINVPLFPVINGRVVVARLERHKEAEDVPPVAARLDLDHRSVVPEQDGKYLDLDGLAVELQRAVTDPTAPLLVKVPFTSFKPRVTSTFLKQLDIREVMASYETKFGRGGSNDRRARNVEIASSRVNGLVISPGGSISFNEIVGARSEENGFQKAGEIFKGEMIEGVGGGTCQVASTLHAVAFFGGLDVVERVPHSRPSAYIPMGLDATVVYPGVDLKIRNPFPFSVVVHAFIDGSKLKMELLGGQKPVTVTYGQTIVGSFPFTRKVVEEDWVQKPVTKQKGIRGYQIKRSRTMVFADGRTKIETSLDMYPPTIEIFKVPVGFDQQELPPLDEPAKKADEAG